EPPLRRGSSVHPARRRVPTCPNCSARSLRAVRALRERRPRSCCPPSGKQRKREHARCQLWCTSHLSTSTVRYFRENPCETAVQVDTLPGTVEGRMVSVQLFQTQELSVSAVSVDRSASLGAGLRQVRIARGMTLRGLARCID